MYLTIGTQRFVRYIEVSAIEGCPLSGVSCMCTNKIIIIIAVLFPIKNNQATFDISHYQRRIKLMVCTTIIIIIIMHIIMQLFLFIDVCFWFSLQMVNMRNQDFADELFYAHALPPQLANSTQKFWLKHHNFIATNCCIVNLWIVVLNNHLDLIIKKLFLES